MAAMLPGSDEAAQLDAAFGKHCFGGFNDQQAGTMLFVVKLTILWLPGGAKIRVDACLRVQSDLPQ